MAPFTIAVPEQKLASLKAKLAQAEFPDELNGAAWDYGAPLADVKRLAAYWKHGFDWRAQEAKLNRLPNFRSPISVSGFGSLDIHFIHQPSPGPDAIPLLFVHGWPGSYIEVTKMVPALRKSTNCVSFHVVALSLPHFGWSSGVGRTGFGLKQYAEVCDQLMRSLGYNKYVTQGGDWGFYITRAIGLLYPDRCMASHINMVRANNPPNFFKQPLLALEDLLTPHSERDKQAFERSKWFSEQGSGYRLLQCTKPQTLGYALQDSPVALLAWIYEKLHDWVDDYKWTDDEILTWVSIYLFSTAGPAASVRIYYEATHAGPSGVMRERTQEWIPTVKLGLAQSPMDLSVVPSTWARTLGPVVYESNKTRGGHFAAWEQPDEIVKDLVAMFGKGGPCYRITGKQSKL